MGKVREVSPAVLVAGITFSENEVLKHTVTSLEDEFGQIEFKSAAFDFDMTDYYTTEMGENLSKIFCAFKNPIEPGVLPDIKLKTNEIELRFARRDKENPLRTVNIDPGYITLSKLVLASTKDYSHRIFIGKGIYAETTLRFLHGSFMPIDTTYPDYRTPLTIDFFNRARDYFKRNRDIWIQKKE